VVKKQQICYNFSIQQGVLMSSVTYKNTDNRLADFEHTLNTLGYIPVVSTISGAGRIGYGSVESVAGSTACAFKSCQYFITGSPEHRNEAAAYYWYAVHGQMNINRGVIEMIPFFGNAATFLYDKGARLRANYTYEMLAPRVLPIFEPGKSVPGVLV
jgi:hypothetical protein